MTQSFLIDKNASLLGINNGKTHEELTPVCEPVLNKDLSKMKRKYLKKLLYGLKQDSYTWSEKLKSDLCDSEILFRVRLIPVCSLVEDVLS